PQARRAAGGASVPASRGRDRERYRFNPSDVSSDETDVQCHRHDDRQAERLCDACETPLCAECVLREQPEFDACSFSCADRLIRLAEEKKEAEELDPLPTRIWTSLFLVIFLTVVGGLAGGFLAFGLLGRRRGY